MRYEGFGRCIYCGALPTVAGSLCEEHIIPRGLLGSQIIDDASCRDCARVTGGFEQKVLHGPLLLARQAYNIKGRNRGRKFRSPQDIEIVVRESGVRRRVRLGETPFLAAFPKLTVPRMFLSDAPALTEYVAYASHIVRLAEPVEGVKPIRAGSSPMTKLETDSFLRMLAKIAYCFHIIRLREILPELTGQQFNWQHSPHFHSLIFGRPALGLDFFIGCNDFPPDAGADGDLHRVIGYPVKHRGQLLTTMFVQLFGFLEAPTYQVVTGSFGHTPSD